MGTKRHLAPLVRSALLDASDGRPVLDLFAGMGSVAESLASEVPVVANDFLQFTTVFGKARFLDSDRTPRETALRRLIPPYLEHRRHLRRKFARRLAAEQRFLDSDPDGLARWMRHAPHAGRSDHYQKAAAFASKSQGCERYEMVTLYYSAGYFSTSQTIDLDSIRWAIESRSSVRPRSWTLAAWLQAASSIINAPGHAAQYLKPNGDSGYNRTQRYWRRSAWEAFASSLESLQPVGTQSWRRKNQVHNRDALTLLEEMRPGELGAVYADPPYTRDQYHRFYHVYESMYLYDFPEIRGEGRTPAPASMRNSGFSRASSVQEAFESLFEEVKRLGVPLVLSYPSNGLLATRGAGPAELAAPWLRTRSHLAVEHVHSTMGASTGGKSKRAEENLYVLSAT